MARITVEDCIDKVDGPYDLVLIAKERAVQLNSGVKPNVDPKRDKNTVIALKEIAENKISVTDLEESAINKLRKHVEQDTSILDQEESDGDNFENFYKGEVSKSGISILPSKRIRRISEKKEFSEDIKIKDKDKEKILEEKSLSSNDEVSLEKVEEKEKAEERLDKINNSDNSDTI